MSASPSSPASAPPRSRASRAPARGRRCRRGHPPGRLDGADEEVGADAVGDEGLGAVDDVAAVDPLGEGGDAGDVGAGAGLGDPQRADLLAGDPRHEPALLLLLGAEVEDRRHRDRGVRVEPSGDAARAARRASSSTQIASCRWVAALAAVLLGELEPEEAELGAALIGWRGNSRAASHSSTLGAISFVTNRLTVSRSSSCSEPNGGSVARTPLSLTTVTSAHREACAKRRSDNDISRAYFPCSVETWSGPCGA